MEKDSYMKQIKFVPVGQCGEAASPRASSGSFRIVSWNTLADQYCHYQQNERPNAHWKVFNRKHRHKLLGQTFQHFVDIDVDFICLQEVDFKIARQTLVDKNSYTRLLTPTGYGRGDTRVDACCIFYKSAVWELVGRETIVSFDDIADVHRSSKKLSKTFRTGNFGIIACFQHRSITNKRIMICNTHLYWNPQYEYVKLRQAHYLCQKAEELIPQFQHQGVEPHLIFCGDFNSLPGGLVHKYFTLGEADTDELPSFPDTGLDLECPLRHHLFASAYTMYDEEESCDQEYFQFTNSTADFYGVIDYIFFHYALDMTKILSSPAAMKSEGRNTKYPSLPTKEWPSDHLAIGAEFSF